MKQVEIYGVAVVKISFILKAYFSRIKNQSAYFLVVIFKKDISFEKIIKYSKWFLIQIIT